MKSPDRPFGFGLVLTALLAGLAAVVVKLKGVDHLGMLSVALLLGMAWRAGWSVPESFQQGISFSAKSLLRLGIILLGVRLNLDLVLQAGFKVVILDVTVITAGLVGITWLGRRFGLDATLACLIAVDSSICGASAVAAAAPTLRARDDETALVIPLGSLIGTTAMLAFTLFQQIHPLSDARFGLIVGSTLQEVAQVMAATNTVPAAIEMGTVTKLMRVVLLVPAVVLVGQWIKRQKGARAPIAAQPLAKPWFVLGFLLVGVVNTWAFRHFPSAHVELAAVDGAALKVANGLMAMAMVAMGLQVDFARLRRNGPRALATAVIGWLGLASLAVGEILVLTHA